MTESGNDVTGFIVRPELKKEAEAAFITLALAVCEHTKNKNEAQMLLDNIHVGLSKVVRTKLERYQ